MKKRSKRKKIKLNLQKFYLTIAARRLLQAMTNEIKINGNDNTVFQDVHDSTISVTKILAKSYEYNDLLDKLKIKQELFDLQPEKSTERRLQLSAEINEQKDKIEQFKKDVLALAETFNKIEINTDRLIRAKKFFDKGEFGEARAVLETELEQMQDEQAHLLREKEHFEKDVLPALTNNSEEFFLLAMSIRTDYNNPNRFEDTCKYFEASIKSKETEDNLFGYAYFLNEHNQFSKAVDYYNQYLNKFANKISLQKKAMTLNNLANLHRNQNEYEKASDEYEKVLKIYRNLAKDNPQTYLFHVAVTLNNLAILHTNQNEYEKASNECEEALEIRRNLAKSNPQAYLPDVAMTLNNLAILHDYQNEYKKASDEYKEVLEIYRNLAKDNPQAYLFYVTRTLNNLAILHVNQNEYEKASSEYEEALKMRRDLAKGNPQAYLFHVATTLNNLAILHANQNEYEKASNEYEEALKIYRNLYEQIPKAYAPGLANTLINLSAFYQDSLNEREKSLEYVIEAVILLRPIVEAVPFTQRYIQSAVLVLHDWGLNDEEIERLIEKKMKETGKNKT
jgi:tetratricopeptide (TPR) repeat protein